MHKNKIAQRFVAIYIALVFGWAVFLTQYFTYFVYDGVISSMVAVFHSAFISMFVVTWAFLAGLILIIPRLSRIWTATPVWAIAMITTGLFLFYFGFNLGITNHLVTTEGSYFILLFGIVNWPFKRKINGKPKHETTPIENWFRSIGGQEPALTILKYYWNPLILLLSQFLYLSAFILLGDRLDTPILSFIFHILRYTPIYFAWLIAIAQIGFAVFSFSEALNDWKYHAASAGLIFLCYGLWFFAHGGLK